MARKAELGDVQTPISSLIDVVFLLIIFFVVTAAQDKEIQDEKVILADAPHGKPLVKKDPLSVIINVRQDGVVTIAGRIVSIGDMTSILSVQANKYGYENVPIIIRGDRMVQHGYIKRVLEAIKDTRLYRVKFNAEVDK